MSNSSIDSILISKKIITQKQLDEALELQKKTDKKLGQILIDEGLIEEKVFYDLLSEHLKVPFVDLLHFEIDYEITKNLPENYARRFQAILLNKDSKDESYTVGMVDPADIFTIDELKRILNKKITIVLVKEKDLIRILDLIYRRETEIKKLAKDLLVELKSHARELGEDVAIQQADTSISKLIDSLFIDAVQVNASDIHIEPAEDTLRIRLRVDGLLQEQTIQSKEKHIANALSQKLKLMANLNIAEKRLPQDGSFNIKIHDNNIDVRLSTMPTQFGESIVMRLLNQSVNILDLNSTGMPTNLLERFRQLIHLPRGIVLVTGPTGSGKTTTLYSALIEINDVTKNIITIEDPVEYRIERLNQVQVNPQLDLSFARVLRASLRQDPNIILVGEIRDQETAAIALRAALTGHLVFATLHTNDAASTVIRLIDIGVENYLVAATVRAVLAQRLVRKICDSCSASYQPNTQEQLFLNNFFPEKAKTLKFQHGIGCANCNYTGYKGRTGIYELLEFDFPMLDALRRNDTSGFYNEVAKNRKTKTLLESALDLAEKNITTLSEVVKVAGEQS